MNADFFLYISVSIIEFEAASLEPPGLPLLEPLFQLGGEVLPPFSSLPLAHESSIQGFPTTICQLLIHFLKQRLISYCLALSHLYFCLHTLTLTIFCLFIDGVALIFSKDRNSESTGMSFSATGFPRKEETSLMTFGKSLFISS